MVGLAVYFLLSQFAGGSGIQLPTGSGFGNVSNNQQVDSAAIREKCKTGADANTNDDCAGRGDQLGAGLLDRRARQFRHHLQADTPSSSPAVHPAAAAPRRPRRARSTARPTPVYIDLSFCDELKTTVRRQRRPVHPGLRARPRVRPPRAEPARHQRPGRQRRPVPTTGSVRLELQADCYAGVWANHATTVPDATDRPLITEVTDADLERGAGPPAAIGDDYIQSQPRRRAGRPEPVHPRHLGAAAEVVPPGFDSGDPARCNTFDTNNLG